MAEKQKGPNARIKIQLNGIFKTTKDWRTRIVWKKILQADDVDIADQVTNAVQCIKGEVENESREFKKKTSSEKSWVLRKQTALGEERIIKNKKGNSHEVTLERLFTAFGKDLFNQFNLLSGVVGINQTAQAIDIVVAQNNKISEMIELKAWDNKKDHPLAAAIEVLMNYYIYKAIYDKGIESKSGVGPRLKGKIDLTVLAPEEYYAFHCKGGNSKLKVIEEAINKALRSDEVEFSFEALGSTFNRKDYDDLVRLIERFNGFFSNRSKVRDINHLATGT